MGKCLFFSSKSYGYLTRVGAFDNKLAVYHYHNASDSLGGRQDSGRMIPRITMNDMPPALAEMLRPKVERLGYLGEFFQCAANQPDALMSFMKLTDGLKEALPDNVTEIVALTVSNRMSNVYERRQHERLSLKFGFGEQWLRDVLSLGESSGSMKPEERLVQQLVLAVLKTNGHDAGGELDRVVEAIGAKQAIAVLLLIGRYITHALLVNTLKLAPPVPSPLERL